MKALYCQNTKCPNLQKRVNYNSNPYYCLVAHQRVLNLKECPLCH